MSGWCVLSVARRSGGSDACDNASPARRRLYRGRDKATQGSIGDNGFSGVTGTFSLCYHQHVRYKNQSGFGSKEVAFIVLMLLIIGAIGLILYQRNAALLFALRLPDSWATGTLASEHATFRYPKSWSINVSPPATCGSAPCPAPDNFDDILLTGNGGFSVRIDDAASTGVFNCPPPEIVGSSKIGFMHEPAYFVYLSDPTSACAMDLNGPTYNGKVSAVGLNASATSWGDDVKMRQNSLSVIADYTSSDGSSVYMPLDQAKRDINYQDVLQLIESVKYQ